MPDDPSPLHPAEHRAYRELYVACRQLSRHWGELTKALAGTKIAAILRRGAAQADALIEELKPRTAAYGLHAGPAAYNVGARIADLRNLVADRGADTGMAVRLAVLDAVHVATLLGQLAELARSRDDEELAGFCDEWRGRMDEQARMLRDEAVALGADPDRVAAPLGDSLLSRAVHGAGWFVGAFGEAVDKAAAGRRD